MNDRRPLIMHVVYSFDVGGLENGVVNLINRLPEDDFRHSVVALTRCAPAFCERVTRRDVDFISLHKPQGHGIQLYPALYRLFRARRPAVVHTRNLAALEAVVPAWAARVPVRIHGEHGWDASDPDGRSRKFQWMRRLYTPFVSRYVALSGHLERYLHDAVGISPARIERICNGVDTRRFQVARPRALIAGAPVGADGEIVVGTVGRLQTVKDQVNLVRAFALALQQAPDVTGARLVIAGDGPQRAQVEAEIARSGIGERVWLAGERKDVPDVMRGLDVFVLPSLAEGISNTILEAMACGLPVLATDVGGNAELVAAGDTGGLVPPADSQAMATALIAYLRHPALRQRHGEAGRRRAEAVFSLDGMINRYHALYDNLLAAAGQPREAVGNPT
ncbi:TIGR03088 family PEP-CTERM/XrtA system glycosyltransferase [Azoarcus olearius]|uniref:Glycosyltransferase n=1 Tax=Azoarcus sp. (strain BH72) TaxID=418699 RepID=A1KAN4_AZOSB|nr:TIGR03088 family PEP-CTERM/XrtA system glycosyltransferase [Azoarcus olearius]CAL95890.1 glycosyltransferase [Azoarcus olearius]